MGDCKRLGGCPFFNDQLNDMPSTAEMYKRRYCRDDHTACARYQVAEVLGKERVPDNLFPGMLDRVQEILAQG